ncbi:MAG: hypothetical protein AAF213_05955 [Pseudomonadota bacterium]
MALLPILPACNLSTTSGERHGLNAHAVGETGTRPLADAENINPGLDIPVPDSRILGTGFDRPQVTEDPLAANKPLPTRIYKEALNSAARGNFTEAAAYYALLHHREPGNETLAIKYAQALRRSGSAAQALAVLKPFAEPEIASPKALVAYAKTNLTLKQTAAAVQAARWAIDSDPTYAEAYHVLGITLDALGNHREAQAAYQSALANGIGESHRTLNNLAMSYAQSGELGQARSSLEQAQELATEDQTVQANLTLIRTMEGQEAMKPTLPIILPTRVSAEPVEPVRHPAREWPKDDSPDPRRFQTVSFDSFDRLILPKAGADSTTVQQGQGVLVIKLPASATPNLKDIRRNLDRVVANIAMRGDDDGITMAFELRDNVAVTQDTVDGRLQINFLIGDETVAGLAPSG